MRYLRILTLMLITCMASFGQPGDPPPDPGDPVPFSGLEWLIGAGAALGIAKRLRDKTRSRRDAS